MRFAKAVALVVTLFAFAGVSFASLLGAQPGSPSLAYGAGGAAVYDATQHVLSINATPIAVQFAPNTTPDLVTTAGSPPVKNMTIQVLVDNTGALIYGAAGNNLVVTGEVNGSDNNNPDFVGVLLAGTIVSFGFQPPVPPSTTALFDFRFQVTGGALASFYNGADIGVTLAVENSAFAGAFTANFNGDASGYVGPIPIVRLACPEIFSQVGAAYSSALAASPATSPYTFSISIGVLPPGLTLDASAGTITGTPSGEGIFSFTAMAAGSPVNVVGTATNNCSILVEPSSPPQ